MLVFLFLIKIIIITTQFVLSKLSTLRIVIPNRSQFIIVFKLNVGDFLDTQIKKVTPKDVTYPSRYTFLQ